MKHWNWLAAAVLTVALCGCGTIRDAAGKKTDKKESKAWKITPVTVSTIAEEFRLDGKLDDAVWKKAVRYPLHRTAVKQEPLTKARIARDGFEKGYAMFAKDDKYLYVAANFTDSDILQFLKEDQGKLWRYGDLLEVFLRTDKAPGYWELFASPFGNKSSIFFHSPGMKVFDNTFRELPGMAVASHVQGTVNKHDDIDRGWTTEMRIPIAEVEKACGAEFSGDGQWFILAARYNYGKSFRMEQNSTYPKLPQLQYHLLEYYAPLKF